MSVRGRLGERLRIIGAIAAKDIVDAIRNRTTLFTILMVLFMMVAYRLEPSLLNADLAPRLALYDEGQSQLAAGLGDSAAFDLIPMASQAEMEAYLGNMEIVVLGLVLPADLDQSLAADDQIALDGYVARWASASAAAGAQAFFEAQLTELTGRPVRINIAGNVVYTQKNSRGYALLAALSVIFATTMVGVALVPNIMLEEKKTRTLDALLVSPASPGHVVLGKALTGLFYCLTASAVAFAFNLALVNHWWIAILAAIAGSLFAVALGLLLGSAIENRGQLALWSWVLFIPLLGAPLLSVLDELLPRGLSAVLEITPTVAVSKVLRVSFSNRAALAQFGPELALVSGMAAFILAIVAWSVRRSDR